MTASPAARLLKTSFLVGLGSLVTVCFLQFSVYYMYVGMSLGQGNSQTLIAQLNVINGALTYLYLIPVALVGFALFFLLPICVAERITGIRVYGRDKIGRQKTKNSSAANMTEAAAKRMSAFPSGS